MRGALTLLAWLYVGAVQVAAPTLASDTKAIAQQKAAAVAIIQLKAQKYTATLARGRLFQAYLNASTLSEGDRVRTRIRSSFKALENQYGMRDFTVTDLTGAVLLHVGKTPPLPPATTPKSKKLPTPAPDLAVDDDMVAMSIAADAITYKSPVTQHGETQFMLSVQQDFSAYEKVLALGLAKSFYVAVLDANGNILSDSLASANSAKPTIAEGLTLELLRKETGGQDEGTGVIVKDGALFNVSFQNVGDWTVVAIEPISPASTCLRTGANACQ